MPGSRLIVFLSKAYVAGVAGYFALRHLTPCWPPVAWINNGVPFLFVPLPFVLGVALLNRSKTLFVLALIPSALFLLLYGSLFLPKLKPLNASDGHGLEVMTFNLKFDHPLLRQAILAIKDVDADIVAVQEVTAHTAGLLREELGNSYPYTILDPSKSGVGLLSRFPVQDSAWLFPNGEGYAVLHATLDVDGSAVQIVAVHFLPPRFTWGVDTPRQTYLSCAGRLEQTARLAELAISLEGPVLVMGDFNMSDQTQAYAKMTSVLRDAFREAGWGFGFTFPLGKRLGPFAAPGPLARIDYIFHTGEPDAKRAWVGCTSGSDHCYVVAEFNGLP